MLNQTAAEAAVDAWLAQQPEDVQKTMRERTPNAYSSPNGRDVYVSLVLAIFNSIKSNAVVQPVMTAGGDPVLGTGTIT